MKIVVAPDSFKGSLSAFDAASAMARGILRVFPDAEIVLVPLADGGDGTIDALCAATNARQVSRTVTGPLGFPTLADFAALDGLAVVEMAQAAGLTLLSPERRDPRVTTTFGVGELIRHALDGGAQTLVVGLGGSATNDGGAGALSALGVRFLDGGGAVLPPGGASLSRLARLDLSEFLPFSIPVTLASDVQNPLLGLRGASAIFGPQKGATPKMVAELDAALAHFSSIVERDFGKNLSGKPGAGAAGGLGFGLMTFLDAKIVSGIDWILDASSFDERARGADFVLTGEGKIDAQTLSGKAIFGLAARCRKLGVSLIAFGGIVENAAVESLTKNGLHAAFPIAGDDISFEERVKNAAGFLEDATARAMEDEDCSRKNPPRPPATPP